MPGPLRRIDGFLLRNAPILWRTRTRQFVVYSLVLANTALFVGASVLPFDRTNAPTAAQFAAFMAALYIVAGIAFGYWLYVQFRIPLPERRPRDYAALAAIHAACIASVLLNPLAFIVPAIHRVAEVVPDAEFAREYAYHAGHEFWLCGITPAAIETHRDRVAGARREYGVNDPFYDFQFGESPCDGLRPEPYVSYDSRSPMFALRARLESVRDAKALRDGAPGRYSAYLRRIPTLVLLALLLGSAAVLVVIPGGTWRRTVVAHDRQRFPFRLHVPAPAFLRRLDRYLLVNHPLVWSIRLHAFLFYVLAAVLPASVLVALAGLPLGRERFLAQAENVLWGGVIATLALWLVLQARTRLRAPRVGDNRTALTAYVALVTILCTLATFAYGLLHGWGEDVVLTFFIISILGSYVAGAVYLMKYLGILLTIPIIVATAWVCYVAISLFWFVGLVVPIASTIPWIVATAFLLVQSLRKRTSRVTAVVAGVQIALTPAVIVDFALAVEERGLISGSYPAWAVAGVLVNLAAHVLLTTPAMRTLIRFRYWPRTA